MNFSVRELIDILRQEREIYEKIFHIEEEKSEFIIQRDGKSIQELSLSQEKFLKVIESLENKRIALMKVYKSAKQSRGEITLQDIIEADNTHGEIVKQAGIDLKNILLKVTRVQDLNSQLLIDNMEFYDIIISGLKNSSAVMSGYGSDGKERVGAVNPVLFNIKA